MKTHPIRAELFHVEVSNTDDRTDRHDEANSSFLQFCESTQSRLRKSVYSCVSPSPIAQNTYIFCQWTFIQFFDRWTFCSGCVSNRPHVDRAVESGLGTPPPPPVLKGGRAKNLYNKVGRLTFGCRVTLAWPGMFNLYNQQITMQPRKTKHMQHSRAPLRTAGPW